MKKGKDAVDALYTETEEESQPLRVVLKLRYVLEQRGMTQKELSEITKIRPTAISMLARGYVERLNLDHLERIANALKITDINELLSLETESEAQQYGR